MVGTSKILTVSYGTFSCTLEGFDDPFSTMRSIAEYFRDLAADDRYFGAEPPQPDAEMLHRIAEKEIERRVEARVGDNGVHLRQIENDEEAPSLPSFDEPVEDFSEPAAETDAPEAASESVAEKLSRIRAVVAGAREGDGHRAISEEAANHPDEDNAPAEWDAEPEAVSDELRADADEISMDVAAEDAAEEEADDVAAAVAEFAAQDDFEDVAEETSDDFEFEEETVVTVAEVETFEVAYAPEIEVEDEVEVEEQDQAFAAEDTALEDVTEAEETDEAEAEETDEAEALEEVRVVKLAREDLEDLEAAIEDDAPEVHDTGSVEEEPDTYSYGENDEDDAAIADLDEPFDDAEDDKAYESDTAYEANADADYENVAEAEDAADELEDEHDATPEAPADEDLTAGIRAAIGETSLRTEEEDELLEEIAEAEHVDAIIASSRGEGFHQSDEEEEATLEDDVSPGMLAARSRLGDLASPDEEATSDVERLMDETDSKMEDSEGSRRRSAIAHLKAAVAATKADRLLKRVTKREANEAEQQEQYREDLSAVVRPKRPEVSAEHSERPSLDEPAAPLMLVSELRVDEDDDEEGSVTQIGAIRPRRVSADAEDVSGADEGAENFADFAAKMDAHELPDLLEAAAAYAAFVEGRPHFSRPQLMKRVAKFDTQAEFTREAGLRSFGQLLRQGKIQKLKRGQFTIAETSRFNPDARIAGE